MNRSYPSPHLVEARQTPVHAERAFTIAERAALEEHAALLCGPSAGGRQAALLILELADMGAVGMLFGRPLCDGDVLDAIASRLRDLVQSPAAFYQIGFNQFAVLIASRTGDERALMTDATEMAYRLHRACHMPTRGVAALTVMASIGVAYAPSQAQSASDLIDFADAAMCYSRSNRGTKVTTYGKHAQHLARRRETTHRLDNALLNDEFEVHYQPIVSLRTGEPRIVGVEALLRWSVDGQAVPPDHFIPLLEWSGTIGNVGTWVLETATADIRDLRFAGKPVTLSINVSLPELADPLYLTRLLSILAKNEFDPSRLVLEITESVAMSDLETVQAVLKGAGTSGIRIAIDDFGTGNSSLARIRDLPIDILKIDRSFVEALDACDRTRAIVAGVVDIAQKLNMIVVAEGVETAEQARYLRENHCLLAQGYHFSRPLTLAHLRQSLASGKPATAQLVELRPR